MEWRYYLLDGLLLFGIVAIIAVLIKYPRDVIRTPFLIVKFLLEALLNKIVWALWFTWAPILIIMFLFTPSNDKIIRRGKFTLQSSK